MTARSSQDPSATDGGNSKWYASWGALISEGARALASLMPEPHKGHQVLNDLATDPWRGDSKSRLVDLAQVTAVLLKQNSDGGNLKWSQIKVALQILQSTADGSIDDFMPRMEPFALYGGSDSTLCMYTKGEGRPWADHWAESKTLWDRHISQAHFCVTPSAKVNQIWAGLENVVRHKHGGNPETFAEQLVFISAMNEKTYEKDAVFKDVREELERYPIGSVIIFGPGEADHWWPDCVGSARNTKWTTLSKQ